MPLLLLVACASAQTGTVVVVTSEKASLRVRNADNVEVAAQVTRGDRLNLIGPLEGVWVPVEPPDTVSYWIYAELVRQGHVIVNKAQVRSGAGLFHKTVGSIDSGTPIEVRGKLGDWLKIKPPPSLPVWISRNAVALAPTSAPPDMISVDPRLAPGLLAALADTNAAPTGVVEHVEQTRP